MWRIPLSRVGSVLITHFHADYIGDLGELICRRGLVAGLAYYPFNVSC